jgi:hypothetical protein
MRHFIFAGSAAFCLACWSVPASGAANVTPVEMDAWHHEEQLNSNGSFMEMGDWLLDQMFDRITVPLWPDDQNIWPLGSSGVHRIGVIANRVPVVDTHVSVGPAADDVDDLRDLANTTGGYPCDVS